MKSEIMRKLAEQMTLENKAKAFDKIISILNNAITYMMEQEMTDEEIADYLCCSVDDLRAIDIEDYDFLGREE